MGKDHMGQTHMFQVHMCRAQSGWAQIGSGPSGGAQERADSGQMTVGGQHAGGGWAGPMFQHGPNQNCINFNMFCYTRGLRGQETYSPHCLGSREPSQVPGHLAGPAMGETA